jgi:hypothetical protein
MLIFFSGQNGEEQRSLPRNFKDRRSYLKGTSSFLFLSGCVPKFIAPLRNVILQIGDNDLSALQQADVTAILKPKKVGESICILASRIAEHNNDEETPAENSKAHSPLEVAHKASPSVTFKDENDEHSTGEKSHQHLRNYLARKLVDSGSDLVELDVEFHSNADADNS